MSGSSRYRVREVAVVGGFALVVIIFGRVNLPHSWPGTTISSKPTPYGSSVSENSNEKVSQLNGLSNKNDVYALRNLFSYIRPKFNMDIAGGLLLLNIGWCHF